MRPLPFPFGSLLLVLLALAGPARAEPPDDKIRAAALGLLGTWVKAQNTGQVGAYLDCYDPIRFVGIKRTRSGSERRYDFSAWKQDRARMLAGKPRVVAERVEVTTWLTRPEVDKGLIEVRLVQRFRLRGYADHGDKLLVLRWVEGGTPRIVREEQLTSADGWDDTSDKPKIVDGKALKAPIAVALWGVAAPAREPVDPPQGRLELRLSDAQGTQKILEIGSYLGVSAGSHAPVPSSARDGTRLFEVHLWYAGSGDDLRVVRDGTGLVVKHRWLQETGPEEEGQPEGPWTDVLRVTLAPGAQVIAGP